MEFSHNIPSSLRSCIIENIQLQRQIGYGANGRILEGKWEGAAVAVKEIHSIFNLVSEPEFLAFKQTFLRECEQSNRLRHPNIVCFFGIYLPPGARLPSLVMERLHCSLNNLLEQTPVIAIRTKLSILYDVSLGIRYLHSHNPPVIHRDVSSNNVLLTKGMEAKIGDLGTARLVDPRRQSQMTKAPGTVDFMPPEALAANPQSVQYGRELDVFSFGCVMLHTLSHQWPTPSEPVVTDLVTFEVKGRTEVERRSQYFSRIDRSRLGVLIPLIESCLSNVPKNRSSIVILCEQLEGLVDREHVPYGDLDLLCQEIERKDALLQDKDVLIQNQTMQIHVVGNEVRRKDAELQNKDIEIQRRDAEIEALRSNLSKLQAVASHLTPKQVSNRSTEFWNSLKLTWQQCADLPVKCWANCVTKLDNKVYVTVCGEGRGYFNPCVYDIDKNEWSILPELPYINFSLVSIPKKMQLLAIGGSDSVTSITNKIFLWDDKSQKWLTQYPNMPTARTYCSSASYGSSVIVAGGLTSFDPVTLTNSVEVLSITFENSSSWSELKQLPYGISNSVALIINNNLYIAGGGDNAADISCNIVYASLPQLLQSSNTSSRQVWNKLPDMPYTSWSINHYQGCLIALNGIGLVEYTGEEVPVAQLVPLVHLYNPNTRCWDCVDSIDYPYSLGRSIYIGENKILFVGGSSGTHRVKEKDNLVTSCVALTITPR